MVCAAGDLMRLPSVSFAAMACSDPASAPSLQICGCSLVLVDRNTWGGVRASALLNRGAAYARSGNPDRAIEDYSEAIRLDPYDAAAYRYRSAAYFDKGDRARAAADLQRAARLK